MARYFGALTLVLMVGSVLNRVFMMRRRGMRAMHFGQIDRTDFLIPPFAVFYFYLVLAAAFDWPAFSRQELFHSSALAWAGASLCVSGLLLFWGSLVSFGRSFRVGIDRDRPDTLVTTGVFAFSRNPIYVAFAAILLGQFLIFPSWILLAYTIAGAWLFHRQILREEEFLRKHYGPAYAEYCRRVRRYL